MTPTTLRSLAIALLAALAAVGGCASAPPGDGASPTATPTAPAPPVAPATPLVDTGTIDGAPYRIDIPVNWNGELVMNAHGYDMAGSPRTPMDVPGGMQPLLDRGFAIAASDYSAQGWAVPEGIADTERLRAHFVATHGAPARSWLVGWSMGGLIALASAERHPAAWDGVVSMCGVAVSSEAMFARAALAPLAAFDAMHPGVLPASPDGLAATSLPGEADGDAIEAAFARDEASAAAFAAHFDLPRANLASSLWLYYAALRELVGRAGGFPVASPGGAEGTDGDEAALGLRIRRYAADPAASAYLRRTGALTGKARVPVVLQPNPADPIVPARFSSGYARLAKAAGRAAQVRLLPAAGEQHCRFPPETVVSALEALRSAR